MKIVYIGKYDANKKEVTICRVIDSDISTGAATVFNRATQKIEVVEWKDHRTLWANIRRLAEDTEPEHEAAYKKAIAKYNLAESR